jgi:hypothetical protein
MRSTVSFDAAPEGPHQIASQAPSLAGSTIDLRVRAVGDGQISRDLNQDGNLDVSDLIGVLSYLFLGGPPTDLPCGDGSAEDAANAALLDANGDGGVNLSDPARVLGLLFLRGAPPALGTVCVRIEGFPENCQ